MKLSLDERNKNMKNFRIYGPRTNEESQREKKHRNVARKAAAEGFVLLENNGVLPIKPQKIALYGAGARMTVKGGTGSGDVKERYSVNIEDGLKNAGFTFPNTLSLDRFENSFKKRMAQWKADIEEKCKSYSPIKTMDMFIMIGEHPKPQPGDAPVLDDELSGETDTAVYVLARQAGEGGDRKKEKGDYYLSDIETQGLKKLSAHYKKLILVINCGGVIDLSILDEIRIDAVIFYAQGGMEGGNALADILSGKVTPSGKLTDTWGRNYEDYPSSEAYSYLNGDVENEDYKEGIYVGYRYFDSFNIKPRYAFGYGLSYTSFEIETYETAVEKTNVQVRVKVKNLGGNYSGKEIVQLYLKRPNVRYDGEDKSLVAFAKTHTLSCDSGEEIVLSFDMAEQGVFNGEKRCFVLEKGEYGLYIGDSSDNITLCSVIRLENDVVIEKISDADFGKPAFEDIKSKNKLAVYPDNIKRYIIPEDSFKTKVSEKFENNFSGKIKKILSTLTDKEKISLVVGGGYLIKCFNNVMGAAGRTATGLIKRGIPNIVLSDGPAGLNVNQSTAYTKNGNLRYPDGVPEEWQWGWLNRFSRFAKYIPGKVFHVYHYMTAFPSETLQAQTWNVELVEEIGEAIGIEMLETGVSVWLAPGLNIHRNPLCGRNFEYYSEDPLVSGKMAAAITKGVQKNDGVGVCIKHFCCNNQEENRTGVSENVSQRALREIYLKGFKIAVKEAQPWTIMTSYNKVNGKYVVNSRDFCTEVLRDEWRFNGLVMSDWNSTEQCSYEEAVNAGNDLIMPGTGKVKKELYNALKYGKLNKTQLENSAMRTLSLVFSSETAKGF